jgi:cytochrome c553
MLGPRTEPATALLREPFEPWEKSMKLAVSGLLVLAASLTTGCSSIERSRNLNEPRVPAATLAQQVCSNCHGIAGAAVSPNFPNLAAQSEAYLVAQLEVFRSRARRDPAGYEYMWGLSRHLSDEQVKGLAAYYAAQPPARQPVEGEAARVQAGQAIFEQGVPAQGVPACSGCHGAEGQGLAAFPRLAGQHADYVVKQLMVFQRTEERPEGAIMMNVAHSLTGANIGDVAAYVQSMGSR